MRTNARLRHSTTSVALLAALLGSGLAVATAAPAHAGVTAATDTTHGPVTAEVTSAPALQGFLPLAEVGKAYSEHLLMVYRDGRIVSVTVDQAKLPPGLTARVNPDDTIRVSGTTTARGQFELAVSMTGLSADGEIVTRSSSRELIVSTAVQIGAPASVSQGLPVSTQLPLDYPSGKVVDVSATGLPAGLSMSSTGLITGTTYEAGTFRVAYTAKGLPFGTPPYIAPISTTTAIDMVVAPWTVTLPAGEMPDGQWGTSYRWQLPIEYVNGETVAVTATGLPQGLNVSPTGFVSGYVAVGAENASVTFTVTARPIGSPWVVERSTTLLMEVWWH